MLTAFCVLVILAVAYSMLNEGLFAAVVMLVNVLLAGFLTYSVWEPAADMVEGMLAGTFMAGLEDHLCMMLLFAVFLGVLRTVTTNLTRSEVQFNPNLHRFGGGAVGLLTGYLLAGFLVCALETLPLNDKFLGFTSSETEPAERRYFPPDRMWTAIMRRAGAGPLSWKTRPDAGKNPYDRYRTFDRYGTFELRYLRYRRYAEKDGKKQTLPWQQEISFEEVGR